MFTEKFSRQLLAPRTVTWDLLFRCTTRQKHRAHRLGGCLTVLMDRSMVPRFEMESVPHEDYRAWLRLLRSGVTAWGVQQDLARYRVSAASISAVKHQSALWTWRIYRQAEQLSLPASVWYFAHYLVRGITSRLRDRIPRQRS